MPDILIPIYYPNEPAKGPAQLEQVDLTLGKRVASARNLNPELTARVIQQVIEAGECGNDSNALTFINLVQATTPQVNIVVDNLPPSTDLILMESQVIPVFVSLQPVSAQIGLGGLVWTGAEQWFPLSSMTWATSHTITPGAPFLNMNALRFRKPITRFYVSYFGDPGANPIQFVLSNDVQNFNFGLAGI